MGFLDFFRTTRLPQASKNKLEDYFKINLYQIMDLPLELQNTETNQSGDIVKDYKLSIEKELGIFDTLDVVYFPKKKTRAAFYKIFLKGFYQGEHSELDDFIAYIVEKYGPDENGQGFISQQEYSLLRNREFWIGRMWNTTDDLKLQIFYDDDYNLLELGFHELPKIEDCCDNNNESYGISGINFQNLTIEDVGPFENGYIRIEENNPYDQYAVAIYSPIGVKLGYIGKDFSQKVYKNVLKKGGQIAIRGYIEQFCNEGSEQRFMGEIWLLDE